MISKHYDIREFVPPVVWGRLGERSIWMIDERIVLLAEWMSDYFGRHVIINNWHLGGQYKESAFRTPESNTGASLSAHKRGIAIDAKVPDIDPEVVRDEIRRYHSALYKDYGVTTIEKDTPTWTHVDLRWTGLRTLLEVPYK